MSHHCCCDSSGGVGWHVHYLCDHCNIGITSSFVPLAGAISSPGYKRLFGREKHTVTGTFGLIGRAKGIEYVIDSLGPVMSTCSDAVYVLCGTTHLAVRDQEGESYRELLMRPSKARGIADRIQFVDRYLSDDEVVNRLLATDVYVSSSLDEHQVVSGTLSYAVACGRPVIATNYPYARELVANGREITVPFRAGRSSWLRSRIRRRSDERSACATYNRRHGTPDAVLGRQHSVMSHLAARFHN